MPQSQLEALKRAAGLPLDGRLLTIRDLMDDFRCSRRQVEILIETGELAAFKDGRVWKTTVEARNDFVRRRIAKRLRELEDAAE